MAGLSARAVVVDLGGRRVLDGVGLEVEPGEVVAVRAPSGAGKSTLLRALVRLVPLTSGSVSLDGVDTRGLYAPALRRRVGLVAQAPVMLEGTVADNCRYAHAAAADADVVRALDAAGLDAGFATRTARELSGGERARVALARALVRDPEHLLLDEPTAALDPDVAQRIGRLVVDLASRGLGICLTTHDGAFADRYADRQVSV